MPMYNLLKHSNNFSMTSGRLWSYQKDEIDDPNDNASEDESIEYKAKIIGKTPEQPLQPGNPGAGDQPPRPLLPPLNTEVTIPLKYLSYFWRSLDLPLINCEVGFDLLWTKDCVFTEHQNNITGVNFMISSTKLYAPVVTLSVNDNIKFLEFHYLNIHSFIHSLKAFIIQTFY